MSADRLTGPLKTLLFSADCVSVLHAVSLVEAKSRNGPTPAALIYIGVRKRMCLLWPPVSDELPLKRAFPIARQYVVMLLLTECLSVGAARSARADGVSYLDNLYFKQEQQ